jgi:hypothetical protein
MNFAGGGIIAFADGGDVERYAGGGDLLRTTTGGKSWFLDVPSTMRDPSVPYYREIASPFAGLADKQFATKEEALAAYNQLAPTAAVAAPAAAVAAPTAPAPSPRDDSFRRQPDPRTLGVAAIPPAADTGRKAPGAGLGAAAAAAAPEKSIAQRYADMQKEMGLGPESRADIDKQRKELEASKRAEKKTALEDFEKDVAARGEAFKGREERLAKREAGLGKMKDETTGLALLEAGLAIMSTPGGLATAIGKGAQAGLKTYGAGLEKLRSAQEKMDDARDQIEEFRRNEANMTAKERRQYKNDIARTETEIKQLGLDAAKEMYGFKREDTKAVFTAGQQERLTDKEIAARKALSASDNAARERIAQLPQGNERIAMLLGGGDLAKGLAKFTEIQAGKFNPTTAYTDYISKRKEGDTVLTPQEFVTQIRSIQALMGGAPSVSNKPTGKALE